MLERRNTRTILIRPKQSRRANLDQAFPNDLSVHGFGSGLCFIKNAKLNCFSPKILFEKDAYEKNRSDDKKGVEPLTSMKQSALLLYKQ